MYTPDALIKSFFHNNPFHVQRLEIFATVEKWFKCLAFPYNSPLKVIFARTMTQARETGIQHNLETHWFGGAINENWEVEKTVITPGHVVLIFALMNIVFVFCTAVFCGELIFDLLQSKLAIQNKIRNNIIHVQP
jgi:hypothetical protein